MRRVFKNRPFARWARRSGLSNSALCWAVDEMARGLVDADLGSGVFKKRVALPGRGKRGGARTIVATNRSDRWIFLHGFAKNERENLTQEEIDSLRGVGRELLRLSAAGLNRLVEEHELEEVHEGSSKNGQGQEPDPGFDA